MGKRKNAESFTDASPRLSARKKTHYSYLSTPPASTNVTPSPIASPSLLPTHSGRAESVDDAKDRRIAELERALAQAIEDHNIAAGVRNELFELLTDNQKKKYSHSKSIRQAIKEKAAKGISLEDQLVAAVGRNEKLMEEIKKLKDGAGPSSQTKRSKRAPSTSDSSGSKTSDQPPQRSISHLETRVELLTERNMELLNEVEAWRTNVKQADSEVAVHVDSLKKEQEASLEKDAKIRQLQEALKARDEEMGVASTETESETVVPKDSMEILKKELDEQKNKTIELEKVLTLEKTKSANLEAEKDNLHLVSSTKISHLEKKMLEQLSNSVVQVNENKKLADQNKILLTENAEVQSEFRAKKEELAERGAELLRKYQKLNNDKTEFENLKHAVLSQREELNKKLANPDAARNLDDAKSQLEIERNKLQEESKKLEESRKLWKEKLRQKRGHLNAKAEELNKKEADFIAKQERNKQNLVEQQRELERAQEVLTSQQEIWAKQRAVEMSALAEAKAHLASNQSQLTAMQSQMAHTSLDLDRERNQLKQDRDELKLYQQVVQGLPHAGHPMEHHRAQNAGPVVRLTITENRPTIDWQEQINRYTEERRVRDLALLRREQEVLASDKQMLLNYLRGSAEERKEIVEKQKNLMELERKLMERIEKQESDARELEKMKKQLSKVEGSAAQTQTELRKLRNLLPSNNSN